MSDVWEQLEVARSRLPWHTKVFSAVRRSLKRLRQIPGVVRNTYERARYGYGHRDLWSFDVYLAGVISRGTAELAERGLSYPTDSTPEEWNDYLYRISADLGKYHRDLFTSDTREVHETGTDAMHRFADRFGDMWD